MSRLRINVFPFLLGPLGVTSVLTPPLPLPASITVEFLTPIDWSGEGPDAADDDAVVTRCYDEITAVMQDALDRLREERPHPVRRGVANLARGIVGRATGPPRGDRSGSARRPPAPSVLVGASPAGHVPSPVRRRRDLRVVPDGDVLHDRRNAGNALVGDPP